MNNNFKDDHRQGSQLYPGFYPTVPPGFGRIRRLEKGSQRLQRGQLRPTVGNFTRLPANLLSKRLNNTQELDIRHSLVRKVGGVSVHGVNGSFGFTSTTSSITWYWDGTNGSSVPIIKRADGSSFTVPTAGSPLTITGLANTTDYYFLPFWNTNNLCNIGWVQGTVGSPQVAFVLADTTGNGASSYAIQQTLQGNEPLSGSFMKATTGGGSGGFHFCVRSGTIIEPLGGSPYECEVMPESQWIYLKTDGGKELYCTNEHPLYHALNGKVEADTLVVGDVVITNDGEQTLIQAQPYERKCSKWHIRMERGHLFFANGFLSHNLKA